MLFVCLQNLSLVCVVPRIARVDSEVICQCHQAKGDYRISGENYRVRLGTQSQEKRQDSCKILNFNLFLESHILLQQKTQLASWQLCHHYLEFYPV